METRANYLLIGAFTLAGILGGLAFFVWLARIEIDRQYDYYDVLFDNVAGLSRAAEVTFNGLVVGQVIALGISQENPGKMRVRIEIAAGTPVREDTSAKLQVQGVTGVSYVSLSGGSPGAPLLLESVEGVPVIFAERSIVETLTEDAPDLVTEAIAVLRDLQTFIGPDNQAYVAGILANLDKASGQLETALADFSSISGTISDATGQFGDFAGRLEVIGGSAESALATAEQTLKVAEGAFAGAETTLASADRTFRGAEVVIRDQVPGIVDDLAATAGTLRAAVAELESEARTTLGEVGAAAGQAGDRLAQLEATIAGIDATLAETRTTLAAVTSASTSVETLVDGDGAALVADARRAIADAQESLAAFDLVVAEDVPATIAEVRTAVERANAVIEQVGKDVSGFTGQLQPLTATADTTLHAAAATFRDASATLARLDVAMDTAERTLAAAEGAFVGADRIIGEEVAPTAADIRAAAARFGTAVDGVSADLPEITGELRATLSRATEVMGRIDAAVAASAPPVQEFATSGLPQFTRFSTEARALIVRLERIADRLERDPARFFLGGQAPDYRR